MTPRNERLGSSSRATRVAVVVRGCAASVGPTAVTPTVSPGCLDRRMLSAWSAVVIVVPSTTVSTSPLTRPAAAAGEPSTTCSTRAPVPSSTTRSHTRLRATIAAVSLASTISWVTCSR